VRLVLSKARNKVFSEAKESAEAGGHQTADIMRDIFGLDIPYQSVPLPSRGLLYGEGHSLHLKDSLDITPMTAKEEDILTSPALAKSNRTMDELIKSCLVDKTIDPSDLLLGDRNALMFSIRITGYGTSYDADLVCKECSEKFNASFNLAELEVDHLSADPVSPGENIFEFKLPITGLLVRFKLLNGRDEKEIEGMQQRRKKSPGQKEARITDTLFHSVISIVGNKGEVTDRNAISTFIRKMPAGDSSALRNYIDEISPGINTEVHINCTQCGEGQLVTMPIGVKFFWPSAKL
jgi:hypothetical protein